MENQSDLNNIYAKLDSIQSILNIIVEKINYIPMKRQPVDNGFKYEKQNIVVKQTECPQEPPQDSS